MNPADILSDLLRVRGDVDRLIAALTPVLRDTDRDLLAALYSATGGASFVASEAWEAAEAQRRSAHATGGPLPLLPELLDASGIHDAGDLGRWLGRQESGVERAPKTRHGVVWQISLPGDHG